MARGSGEGFPTPDHSKMGKDKSGFLGPLYTEPQSENLGPVKVGDPRGGKSAPDPTGFLRHAPKNSKKK